MFSLTERSAMIPSTLRSSGQYAIPLCIASIGALTSNFSPLTYNSPPSGLSAP